MTADTDVVSLRHEELVTLVQQLRQQLAARGREIAHLRRQLAEGHALSTTDAPLHKAAPAAQQASNPGSQEDLLAQLEQVYPPR